MISIKPPLTKPKTGKNTPDKRRDSQLSLPCLTEPNQPCKESPRCSEITNIPPERPSVERARLQKLIKEKEACALDYLRGLSDEESDHEYDRKRTLIDEDIDPLNDPDRLSPFMQSTRRQMSQPQNLLAAANSTQTKFSKKIKRKSKDLTKKDTAKRVQSEPDEKTLTRNTKSQSCQFTLYELLPKEPLNRVTIGTDLIDLPAPLRRAGTLNNEKYSQNIMTEPDYYDITAPNNENKFREITNISENSKAPPPILQVRRLVGQNYTRILQGMREYRDTGVMRDMRSIPKGPSDKREPGLSSSKKAFQPPEKKYAMPSTFRHVPKHIVMVGRSVSVSKIPGDFENDQNKEYSSRRLSIEDTREKRLVSWSDQSKDLMKGMRSVSSAGTSSRRNFRGDSEFDTRQLSKDQDMKNLFFEDQNPKFETEENPVLHTKVTNESPMNPVVAIEKDIKEIKDIKDIKDTKDVQELKIGFWFKAKKNMFNPPSPKREPSVQEKMSSSGMNFRKKRDTCKENKALLDKVSEVYKFKIGVINPQPMRQASKSPLTERLGHTKTVLNVHDLNLYKKDNRQSTSVTKQNSHRESLSIDLKGLDGRPPKLKTIVNVFSRELKTDRPFSPARTRSNNSHIENRPIKGMTPVRKGLDSLAHFLNMKGSGIRLKQSRIDYM